MRLEKGDLFEHVESHKLDALAHGVNCLGYMGAGIALQFKNRYPEMNDEYWHLCSWRQLMPGDIWKWESSNSALPSVYNLATQYYPGADARITAISRCVRAMLEDAEATSIERIGIPVIGAGIGGLRRDDVLRVLQSLSSLMPTTELVVFEL